MTKVSWGCRICGNASDLRPFVGREMMFGWRETFDYFECPACGCLQIAQIPENLGKYYPDEYYSFKPNPRLKTFIKGAWLAYPFTWEVAMRRVLAFIPGTGLMPEWMKRAHLKRDAAILDVGSGSGTNLTAMRQAGYRDLTGVDPYIRADVRFPNGIQILKREIQDLSRSFDFVMMHHALEHMPDQVSVLTSVRRVLKDDGTLLIRIPVASSYAWKTYGMDWPGTDPPRHLYIHTPGSFRLVADKAGWEVVDVFYDGDFTQFVGSEQYRRDIPLFDPRSFLVNRKGSIFSRRQLSEFKQKAAQLNRQGLGDSAAFYLRKRQP